MTFLAVLVPGLSLLFLLQDWSILYRVLGSGALAVAAYHRFNRLRDWTESLALEFAVLIARDSSQDDD